MVFYYDLEVFASVNGIDRTADHAMWIRAGPARGSNHKIVQASSSAKQARDRHTVRLGPVLLDTTSSAGIAPRAVVQVEDENALTFVESLSNVLIEDSVTDGRTAQTGKRLFNDSPAKHAEFAQHLEEIGTAKLRQFQMIQRRAGRRSYARWKDAG